MGWLGERAVLILFINLNVRVSHLFALLRSGRENQGESGQLARCWICLNNNRTYLLLGNASSDVLLQLGISVELVNNLAMHWLNQHS